MSVKIVRHLLSQDKACQADREKNENKNYSFSHLNQSALPAKKSQSAYLTIYTAAQTVGDIYRQHHLWATTFSAGQDHSLHLQKRAEEESNKQINDHFRKEGHILALFSTPVKYRTWKHCKYKKKLMRSKLAEIDPATFMNTLVQELHERCPQVCDVLFALCSPLHLQIIEGTGRVPAT